MKTFRPSSQPQEKRNNVPAKIRPPLGEGRETFTPDKIRRSKNFERLREDSNIEKTYPSVLKNIAAIPGNF